MNKIKKLSSFAHKINTFLEIIFIMRKNIKNPFSIYFKDLEVKSKINPNSYKYNTGIVIQGSISNNFEKIRKNLDFYNKNFPNLKIVLSTWEDEVEASGKINEFFKGHIILNKKPTNFGPSNVNLQIISTISGLQKLKELGVERAIKIRSDFSHMNTECINLLEDRVELAKQITNSANNSIVIISMNNFIFRLFGISDFFQYGNIEELINLWDIPLDPRISDSPAYLVEKSILDSSKMRFSEAYIFTHYLEKKGFKIEWTLKNSVQALVKYTIPINSLELGLYWNKYSYLAQRFSTHRNNWKFEELDFNKWLYFALNPNNLGELSKLDTLIENRAI